VVRSILTRLDSAEQANAPFRHVHVDLSVALRPRFVERIAGTDPAAVGGILAAENLCPAARKAGGTDPIFVVGERTSSEIDDGQNQIRAHRSQESQHLVGLVPMADPQRIGSQSRMPDCSPRNSHDGIRESAAAECN